MLVPLWAFCIRMNCWPSCVFSLRQVSLYNPIQSIKTFGTRMVDEDSWERMGREDGGSEEDRGNEAITFRILKDGIDWDGTTTWIYWIHTDTNLFRGRHLSYQRGKRNTTPGTSLIQIEGVNTTEAAKYVFTTICEYFSILTYTQLLLRKEGRFRLPCIKGD